MQTYRIQFLQRCTSTLIPSKYSYVQQNKSKKRLLSSFTKTEIAIPVPISGGHLAGLLQFYL